MRWRWSVWDALVPAAVATIGWIGVRVMGAAPGPVPRHWGLDGRPDAYGPPNLAAALVLPGLALLMYLGLRAVAGLVEAYRRESGCFVTEVAGLTGLLMVAMEGLSLWGTVRPENPMPFLTLIGLYFGLLGTAVLRHRRIPWNVKALGIVLTGPEEDRWRRVMGWSFAGLGALVAAAEVLPGPWRLLGLVLLVTGPLAPLIYLLATTRQRAQ